MARQQDDGNGETRKVDFNRRTQLRRSVRFPAPLHAADGKAVSTRLLKQVFDILADRAGDGRWQITYDDIAREANIVRNEGGRSVPKTRQIKRAVSVLKRIGIVTVTRTRWGNEYGVDWQRVREFCEMERATCGPTQSGNATGGTSRSATSGPRQSATCGPSDVPLGGPTSTSIHKQHQNKESTPPQTPGGLFEKFSWGKDINVAELRTPNSLQALYQKAVEGRLLKRDSEQDRIAFFAFARCCLRTAKRNAPGLFNFGFRERDKFGKGWRQKPSADDEDWARRTIHSVDTGHAPIDPYQAALQAEAHTAADGEQNRQRQIAELATFSQDAQKQEANR